MAEVRLDGSGVPYCVDVPPDALELEVRGLRIEIDRLELLIAVLSEKCGVDWRLYIPEPKGWPEEDRLS